MERDKIKHIVNMPEYVVGGASAAVLVLISVGVPIGFLAGVASMGIIGSGTSIAVTDSFFPSKKE